MPAWLRSLFQSVKLVHHESHRAGLLALSHCCADPGPLLEEAGAKASQNITEMTTLATKKRPDTLSLSSTGMTWGHDVIQTSPSNKALTGTGCGRPQVQLLGLLWNPKRGC